MADGKRVLMDALDDLSRAEDFIKAAYMATCGSAQLDSNEKNAMVRLLDETEEALQSVKTIVTDLKDQEVSASGVATGE